MSILSIFGIIVIINNFLLGGTIQGWTPLMLMVTIVGGIQHLAFGVTGEYLDGI